MTTIPHTPWATTEDVANYLAISRRQFYRLRSTWIQQGRMKEGRHFRCFGPRTVRYNLPEMAKLAHSRGRIIPAQRLAS